MLQKYQFPLLFIAIFLVFQLGYWLLPDNIAKGIIVNKCTVEPSALLINMINDESQSVTAVNSSLVSAQTKINILRGCEGLEALFLLFAAVLACRKKLSLTIIGLAAGFGLVYIINQVRIIALHYISYLKPSWFDPVHGYIAPLIIIGIAWLFFSWWVKLDDNNRENSKADVA